MVKNVKSVVKKTEYDKLVAKVNGIDTTNFVSKTKNETDGSDFEDKINKIDKKIPVVSNLVKKSALTAVENSIPDISGLATTSALTAVENKIPNVSSLVNKTDYDTKHQILKKKLLIITMTNILLLQNLILCQQMFLMQD